jgi:hypothetical protein
VKPSKAAQAGIDFQCIAERTAPTSTEKSARDPSTSAADSRHSRAIRFDVARQSKPEISLIARIFPARALF